MRMYDLIMKKRNGDSLTKQEIEFIINGYTHDEISDYQMSAFLMSVYFNGMNKEETVNMTMAMAMSGDILDLSEIKGLKADKHSTGGVGDKTTLILSPMLAALGVPVGKMSGRGLGHTGGTIDKLESFDGFRTNLSKEDFIHNVNSINLSIVGQTANLAPADKKIYALRDVTATVDNISLIASSIMSKKIAAGCDVIVLDVKTGSGAFMKTEKEAVDLAKTMVSIGTMAGKETVAVISDMNQPLGITVGNSLEVQEAIRILKGVGDSDLLELSVALAALMLIGVKKAATIEEAKVMLYGTIKDGSAVEKLAEFVEKQGGNRDYVYDTNLFAQAEYKEDIRIGAEGYLSHCNTSQIGQACLALGGGRETKESQIDLSVGVVLYKKLGDFTKVGDVIATIYANNLDKIDEAAELIRSAYQVEEEPSEVPRLIKRIITKEDL